MTVILILAAVVFAAALASAVVCSFSLKVTEYSVGTGKLKNEIKAVCISDLHGKKYGKNNTRLISVISELRPDVILLCGDMVSRRASEKDIAGFVSLLGGLLKLAPVYYSAGNHEVDYMSRQGSTALLRRISDTGAVVLYDSFAEAETAGGTLRIGGAAGHYRDSGADTEPDYAMLEEIGSAGVASVVMMHLPENLVTDGNRSRWSADLFIAGHTHGGIWRIPFAGGVIAPTQGLFPKYDAGRFSVDGRQELIISSGLSGYRPLIPRIFNRPEVCVIRLK